MGEGGQGLVLGLAGEHGPSHGGAATQLQLLLYIFLENTELFMGSLSIALVWLSVESFHKH